MFCKGTRVENTRGTPAPCRCLAEEQVLACQLPWPGGLAQGLFTPQVSLGSWDVAPVNQIQPHTAQSWQGFILHNMSPYRNGDDMGLQQSGVFLGCMHMLPCHTCAGPQTVEVMAQKGPDRSKFWSLSLQGLQTART